MFKVISLIFIFASISYSGFIYGESFKKREQILKECIKTLIMLKNEIVYLCCPIEEAFDKVSKKCEKPLKNVLSNVREKLKEGCAESIFDAVKEEYEIEKKDMYLEKNDVSVLSDFFKCLGESTLYGQKALFDLTEEELRMSINEAHESAKKNVKLYRYLGVCVGLMIVIFLI